MREQEMREQESDCESAVSMGVRYLHHQTIKPHFTKAERDLEGNGGERRTIPRRTLCTF